MLQLDQVQLSGQVSGQSGQHKQLLLKDSMGRTITFGQKLSSKGGPPPPPPDYHHHHHRPGAQPPAFETVIEEEQGALEMWQPTMAYIATLTEDQYVYVDFVDCDEIILIYRVTDQMFINSKDKHRDILYTLIAGRVDNFAKDRTDDEKVLVLKFPNIALDTPQPVSKPSASASANCPVRLQPQCSVEAGQSGDTFPGNYGLHFFLIDNSFLQINNFVTLM